MRFNHRRASILMAPIDLVTMQQMIDIVDEAIRERKRLQHTALNVAKLVKFHQDEDLRRDVAESDIVTIDGAGVLWAARLLGHPAPERVTGIDLMMGLLALCERRGYRPFLLGGRQEVLEKAIARLRNLHPHLRFAGFRHGYFSTDEEPLIVELIRSSNADCLMVAISTPIKERFLREHRDELAVPFLMGVGGSIDVIAGEVKRAPIWMQSIGLEWLYRLKQEPRRLWRRYLITNSIFSWLMLKELAQRWIIGRRNSEN